MVWEAGTRGHPLWGWGLPRLDQEEDLSRPPFREWGLPGSASPWLSFSLAQSLLGSVSPWLSFSLTPAVSALEAELSSQEPPGCRGPGPRPTLGGGPCETQCLPGGDWQPPRLPSPLPLGPWMGEPDVH